MLRVLQMLTFTFSHSVICIYFCRFIDTEDKGVLDLSGLRDGFSALGVQLTEEVRFPFLPLLTIILLFL